MRYQVLYQGQVIAESDCPFCDISMGVIFGPFVPLPGYERVRSLFQSRFDLWDEETKQEDPEKLDEYFRAIRDLDLKVRHSDGHFVDFLGIELSDWSALMTDPYPYELNMVGCDLASVYRWLDDHPDAKREWEAAKRGNNPVKDEE